MYMWLKQRLFALSLVPSIAYGDEQQHDMRELCRSEVAGTLLNALNDADFLSGLIAQSEKKIKDIKQYRRTIETEYDRLRTQVNQEVPVFDLDERIVTLGFELDHLQQHIREAEAKIVENRNELQKKIVARTAFESMIAPVFKVEKAKDSPPGAYPIRTDFKHRCGPYELLCPLPKSDADSLVKIAGKLSSPVWCLRYAQLLPP